MDQQFKVILSGDSSQFEGAVKSSQNSVESLKKQLATLKSSLKSGMSVEEFKKAQEEIKGVEQALKQVSQQAAKPTTTSIRQELRLATEQLTEMKLKGQENTAEYEKMSQRAAEIRDRMADVQREIQGAASDTKNFDTALQGVQGVAAVFQIGAGAMALFGEKNEELAKALIKLNGIMAVTQGLQQLGNLLQKESLLVRSVAALQTRALAAAEARHAVAQAAGATATKGATVAQRALNAAMRANPIGIVVTALIAVAGALYYFTRSAGDTSEALKAQRKEAEEFNQSLNQVKASAISAGASLQTYVSIARDSTRSIAERNRALNEANRIMGEHGEKLTLANINTQAVTESVNIYTQALIKQALAAKFADRVADLTIKQAEATSKYSVEQKKLADASKETAKAVKGATGGFMEGFKLSLGLGISQTEKLAGVIDGTSKAAGEYRGVTNQLREAYKQLNNAASEAIALFTDLGVKTKETDIKLKPQSVEVDWSAVKRVTFAGYEDAMRVIQREAQEGIKRRGEITVAIPETLKRVSSAIDAANERAAQQRAIDKTQEHEEALKNLALAASSVVAPAFSKMVDAIAAGENPIKSFLQSIGDGVRQLINQLIQAAVQAALLSLITGGAQGSFGQIFGKLTGLKGLATGGIIPPGYGGDTYPAMLSSYEAVIPLNKLNQYLPQQGGGNITVTGRLRGKDMILQNSRTNQSQRRLG